MVKKVDLSARTLSLEIDGVQLQLHPKTFSSGSKGWWSGGKVLVDGIKCQLSCNLVIVGSKPGSQPPEPVQRAMPKKPRKRQRQATQAENVVQLTLEPPDAVEGTIEALDGPIAEAS